MTLSQTSIWRPAAAFGGIALVALAIFVQSSQTSEAQSLSPSTCADLNNLCAQSGIQGATQACQLSALYCGGSVSSTFISSSASSLSSFSSAFFTSSFANTSASSSAFQSTPSYCVNANPGAVPAGCQWVNCRYDSRGCYVGGCQLSCGSGQGISGASSSSSLNFNWTPNYCPNANPGMTPFDCQWVNCRYDSRGCYVGGCQLSCGSGAPIGARVNSSVPAKNDQCVCAQVYAPVCGANGRTYGNECEARCANVGVLYQGQCI